MFHSLKTAKIYLNVWLGWLLVTLQMTYITVSKTTWLLQCTSNSLIRVGMVEWLNGWITVTYVTSATIILNVQNLGLRPNFTTSVSKLSKIRQQNREIATFTKDSFAPLKLYILLVKLQLVMLWWLFCLTDCWTFSSNTKVFTGSRIWRNLAD